MNQLYQIRLWCSDDSCEEFWFDKELSGIFLNIEDAERELSKYAGKSADEIERMCEVTSVRKNRPRIVVMGVESKTLIVTSPRHNVKEWTDHFIRVSQLRNMIDHLDDDDMITVNVLYNPQKGEHKILGVEDTTCIGFWELRCE